MDVEVSGEESGEPKYCTKFSVLTSGALEYSQIVYLYEYTELKNKIYGRGTIFIPSTSFWSACYTETGNKRGK